MYVRCMYVCMYVCVCVCLPVLASHCFKSLLALMAKQMTIFNNSSRVNHCYLKVNTSVYPLMGQLFTRCNPVSPVTPERPNSY